MLLKYIGIVPLALLIALSAPADAAAKKNKNKFKGTFKIGVEAPLSGDQRTLGEGMLNGAQMAADQINARGGLRRKQVVIVPIDDAADPATGVAAAKRAVKQKLKGVVGPYNSGVGLETLPIYMKKGLLPFRLTSNNATDGMGYTLQPMVDQIAPMAAEALMGWRGAKSVAIIYDSTQNYTQTIAAELKARLEAGGVVISAFTGISPGADSYAAEVAAAAATNPDVIYAATYFPEGGAIAREMHEQNVTARCMVDYGSDDPGFITAAGLDAAMKTDVVGVPSPRDFPAGNAFADAYQARFGTEPGTWSPYAYDSINLYADSVEVAKTWKKKRLKRVLDGVWEWPGITGPVTFDAATGNRVPATLVILSVTAGGQFAINEEWADAANAPF